MDFRESACDPREVGGGFGEGERGKVGFWQFSFDRALLAWLRVFRLRRPLPAAAWRQGRFKLVAAPLAGRKDIAA